MRLQVEPKVLRYLTQARLSRRDDYFGESIGWVVRDAVRFTTSDEQYLIRVTDNGIVFHVPDEYAAIRKRDLEFWRVIFRAQTARLTVLDTFDERDLRLEHAHAACHHLLTRRGRTILSASGSRRNWIERI